MRVGLLIYGNPQTLSGGYLYNRKLLAYLHQQGDQVEIISLPSRSYWRHLLDNFQPSVLKQIAAAKVDVLIQDELAHPSLFLLNRHLQKKAAFPVVTLIHLLTTFDQHPWHTRWFYRHIERLYLNTLSGIIVNSQTTLAQTQIILPKAYPAYCLAVPAGDNFVASDTSLESIQQRTSTSGALKILVVGNVIRRKGLHVLIKALATLPAKDYLVTVAGSLDMEPKYVKQMQRLIKKTKLETQILLKGPVQGTALATLYQEHHIMVLPSAYESYGIVYVEAQQFGLPVIGTRAGAAWEIIHEAENGYLIAPEDHHALAALLVTLQHDRALLLELSHNALATFKHHPRWEHSCALIRQYLLNLINQTDSLQ